MFTPLSESDLLEERMVSINLQGWNKLTDEQRSLINRLICEISKGDEDCPGDDHHEHESHELEHWYTGEL